MGLATFWLSKYYYLEKFSKIRKNFPEFSHFKMKKVIY